MDGPIPFDPPLRCFLASLGNFIFKLMLLMVVTTSHVQAFPLWQYPPEHGAKLYSNHFRQINIVGGQRIGSIQRQRQQYPQFWAKPPPTANFDLEAIEAFEAQLDAMERLQSSSSTTRDDISEKDDDWDPEHDDDDDTIVTYVIPNELNGKRLDVAVTTLEPSLSRSVCGTLILEKKIHLREMSNGGKKDTLTVLDRKSFKVQAGTTIRVELPKEEKPLEIVAQNLPLNILYEDEHMIVINKAAGMVVHPAAGNWDGTVVNALAYYLANESPFGSGEFVGGLADDESVSSSEQKVEATNIRHDEGMEGEPISFRPGIVHRLDKGTTGILVVAKTTKALAELSGAFAARQVKKTYLAITVGNPGKRVVIDKPIGRHPIHRQKMRVVPDPHRKNSSGMAPKDRIDFSPAKLAGRRALSYVDSLAFDGKLSLVKVRIETGRTHQIRVHLQDRHTPIYGDDIYGISDWNKRLSKVHKIERPLLHAYRLELNHPVTGERMVFTAPMAEDMNSIACKIWPTGEDEQPHLFLGTEHA